MELKSDLQHFFEDVQRMFHFLASVSSRSIQELGKILLLYESLYFAWILASSHTRFAISKLGKLPLAFLMLRFQSTFDLLHQLSVAHTISILKKERMSSILQIKIAESANRSYRGGAFVCSERTFGIVKRFYSPNGMGRFGT